MAPKGSAIDWASVDEQLKNKHVNLLLIYEYLRNEEQHIELSYSHFCHLYRKWKAENKASHPVHINMTTPGEKLEIDYSGDNVVWIDKKWSLVPDKAVHWVTSEETSLIT